MRPRRLSPEAIVDRAARGLTRRRMLRNAGGLALGAAMTTAYVGTRPDIAEACTFSDICGPAPLCGPGRCSDWYCVVSAETRYAKYQQGDAPCADSSVTNCWPVCSPGGYRYLCCDCCAKNPSCTAGAACYNCGSSGWRKCICRAPTGPRC